ncbi:ABC transporter substrate-binding protein [Haladaptatus sp. DYF46]|uniref:ABC transporter substrate-binding protein n=1 Tax=Haladaptatus sp. DYF46 TaxID=2886041 RepID=UPI001E3F76A9|nr:ABC transporter substrate-binding protein [Haladaptatus sp. DYF46]
MSDDDDGQGEPTRRDYVKYGGAVVGGGLLAGCSSNGSDTTPAGTATETDTGTDSEAATTTETTAEDGSYSVTMSPVGTVEFETPPENVFTVSPHLAGMTVALGHGDVVNSIYAPEYFDDIWNKFLERLPGVSVNWTDVAASWNPGKELLYELDSDLHLADPVYMIAMMDAWERSDIKEVRNNIAPFFGNMYSNGNTATPDWVGDYQYYSLWDMFEKVAQVFRETDRYDALASIHRNVISNIESNLPSKGDRPTVANVILAEKAVYVYNMNGPGFYRAHTRPLGAVDAFEQIAVDSSVGYEKLIDADPDVLLLTDGMAGGTDMDEKRQQLNDGATQAISAVENDRIYPLGTRLQGPLVNLFQLEMTAKQLYPERFGEWPTYTGGAYPEIPEEEQLFDRQRLTNIVNGEF